MSETYRALKVNKTQMYQLLAEVTSMPPMRSCTFVKVRRQPDYFMRWSDERSNYTAFLAACFGDPLLSVEREPDYSEISSGPCEPYNRDVYRLDAGNLIKRDVYRLNIGKLIKRGMTEEKVQK